MPALISASIATAEQIWPGSAIAALVTVVIYERRLQRVQIVWRAEAFNRGDACALVHDRERQAGINASSIRDHRARAALPLIASFFRAGETQMFAQRVEQSRSRIQFERRKAYR
jgi:hypothetical protein